MADGRAGFLVLWLSPCFRVSVRMASELHVAITLATVGFHHVLRAEF
jgi:hypothetical protein